jgi:hypothetical protein
LYLREETKPGPQGGMEDSNNLKINKGNKIIPSAVFELTTCLIDWVLSPFLNI